MELRSLGNWDQTVLDSVTETGTHNGVNELTGRTIGNDPSISLTYDDAGNLIQDGDHKYVWDYRNRLYRRAAVGAGSLEKQSGTWTTIAEHKYDAKARRVLKVVTNKGSLNGTTRYIWGGAQDWQALEERDSSGNLEARYTYAPGRVARASCPCGGVRRRGALRLLPAVPSRRRWGCHVQGGHATTAPRGSEPAPKWVHIGQRTERERVAWPPL